jgi:hypothetical protein
MHRIITPINKNPEGHPKASMLYGSSARRKQLQFKPPIETAINTSLRSLMHEHTLESNGSPFLHNFLPFNLSSSLNSRHSADTSVCTPHRDTTLPGNQNKKLVDWYEVSGQP